MERYGFAALVVVAMVGATVIGVTATVPPDLPVFALRSRSLYQVEVAGGCFLVFYIPLLAFVLALNGRGFTQLGPRGLKAEQVVNHQQLALKGQEERIESLKDDVGLTAAALRAVYEQLREDVKELRTRLDMLDRKG
ncbi:MAG TPA: hypothetical protein VFI17_09055 [Solirubrobacterales bacterium]|nr:hypothetical protein [Solirubrobacterales bacterium]